MHSCDIPHNPLKNHETLHVQCHVCMKILVIPCAVRHGEAAHSYFLLQPVFFIPSFFQSTSENIKDKKALTVASTKKASSLWCTHTYSSPLYQILSKPSGSYLVFSIWSHEVSSAFSRLNIIRVSTCTPAHVVLSWGGKTLFSTHIFYTHM